MSGDIELLARFVAYAGLIAATIEYCEIMARRGAERQRRAEIDALRISGLRGLVRITHGEGI